MKERKNKERMALEAARVECMLSELAAEYRAHPTMINHWKKVLLDGRIFSSGAARSLRWKLMRRRSCRCMPRSECWLSPMILCRAYAAPLGTRPLIQCHESSSRRSANEAWDDSAEPSGVVDRGIIQPYRLDSIG